MATMAKVFKRAEKNKYSNEEKLELGKLVAKFKEEYDVEVKRNEGKTKYDAKRKRQVPIKPSTDTLLRPFDSFILIWLKQAMMILNLQKQLRLHHVHTMSWSVCSTLPLAHRKSQEELVLVVK